MTQSDLTQPANLSITLNSALKLVFKVSISFSIYFNSTNADSGNNASKSLHTFSSFLSFFKSSTRFSNYSRASETGVLSCSKSTNNFSNSSRICLPYSKVRDYILFLSCFLRFQASSFYRNSMLFFLVRPGLRTPLMASFSLSHLSKRGSSWESSSLISRVDVSVTFSRSLERFCEYCTIISFISCSAMV
jgi:hypothetical protein